MKVLSLFDGMSCGQIALDQLGIPVETYYASEIDKYAIQVTQANYPNTVQVGDVTNLDPKDFADVDLIMGGSPCQGFSFAGKQLAFDDPRSALFFEFIRLLKAIKPRYFLLENVRMKKEFLDIISQEVSKCYPEIAFGIEPILINSSLLSAQSRQRYYWTNIPNIQQPEDRGIVLKDILEDDFSSDRDKSYCIDANYSKTGAKPHHYKDKYRRQLVNKPKQDKQFVSKEAIERYVQDKDSEFNDTYNKRTVKGDKSTTIRPNNNTANIWVNEKAIRETKPKQVGMAADIKGHDILRRVYSPEGKSPTLNSMGGGNREPKVAIVNKKVNLKKYNDEIAINPRNFGGKGYVGTNEKSVALTQPSGNNATLVRVKEEEPKVVTGGAFRGRAYDKDGKRMDRNGSSVANKTKQMLELRKDNKSNAITTVGKDSVVVEKLPDKSKVLKSNYYKSSKANFENDTSKGGKFSATGVPLKAQTIKSQYYKSSRANFERQGTFHATGVQQEDLTWRKLTPLECERLQTVPDNYTNHVSNTQRYKMLGNGWTVEVIKHILKNV